MDKSLWERPAPSDRQKLLARWLVGLMGAAFLAIVIQQIARGELTYGIHDGDSPRGQRHIDSVTVRTPLGLLLALGSFGMMGAGCVLFALVPRAFKDGTLVWIFTAVILTAFAGLALIR